MLLLLSGEHVSMETIHGKSRIQKKVSKFHIGYKTRNFGSNCCFNGVIINNPRNVPAAGMAFMTSSEVINYCRHQLWPTINRCMRTTHHFTTQSSQFPHHQVRTPEFQEQFSCWLVGTGLTMSNSFAGDKKTAFWWILKKILPLPPVQDTTLICLQRPRWISWSPRRKNTCKSLRVF